MSDVYKKFEEKLPGRVIEELKVEAKASKLTDAETTKALNDAVKEYEALLISPGESIGIVTAESFGEAGTQMTLDVFHLAGVAEIQVTRGLPRLIELFDARKKLARSMLKRCLRDARTFCYKQGDGYAITV